MVAIYSCQIDLFLKRSVTIIACEMSTSDLDKKILACHDNEVLDNQAQYREVHL